MPDHPVSEGALCPKGNAALEVIAHPDRLRQPMLRQDGRFRPIGWEEAFGVLAGHLTRVREESGPDAVGFLSSAKCTNEENYLMQKLARVFGTNNVDHCARLCHASTVTGLAKTVGAGAMTNPLRDLTSSDCIFVIGSNLAENHPVAARWICDAKDKGAKVILADPRRTPTAWLADLHLQHRPGTDVALLNAMMSVILKAGLEDSEFIRSRVSGFEALQRHLLSLNLNECASVTGVAPLLIAAAARVYARSDASAIVWSMGVTQHTSGTDNVASCANLALITGQIGRPGAGLFPLRGQNNVQGACDLGALATVLPGYVKLTDDESRKRIARDWGPSDLPTRPGLTVVEMTHGALQGTVRALYVMGENPVVSDPNTGQVREALAKLDFLAVQEIFMSETAELADLVLPAACWAERAGSVTATERRVQWQPKVVEPPGEARADWQILCGFAEKMGLGRYFRFESPEEILREINRVVPAYGGITPVRVKEMGGLTWPCPDAEHPGTPILHTESFRTDNGLAKVVACDYTPPVEEPDQDYPLTLTTGRVALHYNSGTMTRRTKALHNREPRVFVEINEADARPRGIGNGSNVGVRTCRGKCRATARITANVPPGVVFMPFHFAGTNALTVDALDREAKIPELKVAACEIEPRGDTDDGLLVVGAEPEGRQGAPIRSLVSVAPALR